MGGSSSDDNDATVINVTNTDGSTMRATVHNNGTVNVVWSDGYEMTSAPGDYVEIINTEGDVSTYIEGDDGSFSPGGDESNFG